jgi:hypothetical protein
MLRIACDKNFRPPHLEVLKIKPRCHSASHHRKRTPIRHMRCEPAPRPNHRLQDLSRIRIAAQKSPRIISLRLNYMHEQRLPIVEVPNLIRPQPMERREVLPAEQKIDRRGGSSRSRKTRRHRLPGNHYPRPVRLPEIPAFRMRLKLQLLDPVLRIPVRHFRSLESRPDLDTHAILLFVARGPRALPFLQQRRRK